MILYKNGSAKLLNNKVVNNGSLCKFTLDCTNTIWGCEKTRVPGVPDCQEISREKTAIFVTVCKYKITKRKVIEAVVLKHLHDKMSCFVSKVCEQTLIHGQQRYFRDSYYLYTVKITVKWQGFALIFAGKITGFCCYTLLVYFFFVK